MIGTFPIFGDSPRNFCISPDEKYILTANQSSGQVTACPIIPETGALAPMTGCLDLPMVSCVINA